jgi:hypothetical protein
LQRACTARRSAALKRRHVRGPHGGAARRRGGARAARRPRPGACTVHAHTHANAPTCPLTLCTRCPTNATHAQATLLTPSTSAQPRERSEFLRAAARVGDAVSALRRFIAARRREYTDPLRATEAQRDEVEAEVSAAVRDCRERIDALKNAAPAAAAEAAARGSAARTGRSGRSGSSSGSSSGSGSGGGGDVLAHHTGVVLILAERLADTAERFDRVRDARARTSAHEAALRRRRTPAAVRRVAHAQRRARHAPCG